MHTDEYEISLSRELGVCYGMMRKYQRLLSHMERRHSMTTAEFLARNRQGELPAQSDFGKWLRGSEALQYWSTARVEYERLMGIMKTSAL